MTSRVLVIADPPPAGASLAYLAAWQRRMRANAHRPLRVWRKQDQRPPITSTVMP